MFERGLVMFLLSCLLSFLAACGGDSTPVPIDMASPDFSNPCGDPAVVVTQGCGTLSWAKSAVTSRGRNHHVSLLAETSQASFLYVSGGFDGDTTFAEVDRIEIHPDGTLGSFVAATPLPVPTGGHVGALAQGVMVIAGGMRSDKSWSARIESDGTLGAWTAGGAVQKRRMHAGAIASGDKVYVMGGFDNGVWDDVLRTTVHADGTIAEWTSAGTLPGPRSHFTITLVDGYAYLVGGFDKPAGGNPPNLKTVSRGRVLADGSLGEWTDMPALPIGKAAHGAFYYGGFLYVAGGLADDLHAEDSVYRAPIGSDHVLGAWERAAPLPIARGHVHQLPVAGNHVYSISGAIDQYLTSTDEIDIGTF